MTKYMRYMHNLMISLDSIIAIAAELMLYYWPEWISAAARQATAFPGSILIQREGAVPV